MITKKDIAEALIIINTNFPGAYTPSDPREKDLLVTSWEQMLQGIPEDVFQHGLLNAIKHAKFPPRIGDIIEACERIMSLEDKTPEELWDELRKALKEGELLVDAYSYPYASVENKKQWEEKLTALFNGLSEPNRRYCSSVENFMTICRSELEFEKARYMKRIQDINERIQTEQDMQPEVLQLDEELGDKLRLNG